MFSAISKRFAFQCAFRCHSLAKLNPSALFHTTAFNWDSKKKCPESEENVCKVLKKRKCSPTDPPVRCCNEEDCPKSPRYPCCVNTNISDNPCDDPEKRGGKPAVSMWKESPYNTKDELHNYPPECCPKCENTRFDELYYRPSEKCRKYQRTWSECCPKLVPRRVCCWCDAIPPEVARRCLPLCPRSACISDHDKKRLECLNKKSKGCMRLVMPCCRAARFPPGCASERQLSNCKKKECPFPSFSECLKQELAVVPERPHECRCLASLAQCLRDRQAEYMAKHNIKIFPCRPNKY